MSGSPFCCISQIRPVNVWPKVFTHDLSSSCSLDGRAALGGNAGRFPFMDSLSGDRRIEQFADPVKPKNVDCGLECVHAHIQLQVDLNVKLISTLGLLSHAYD
jgi:hypothetical protein